MPCIPLFKKSLCIRVCVHVHMCECKYMHTMTMCGGKRTALGVGPQLSPCLKQGLCCLLLRTGWLASEILGDISVPALPSHPRALGTQTHCGQSQLYVGSGSLNLSPPSCVESTFNPLSHLAQSSVAASAVDKQKKYKDKEFVALKWNSQILNRSEWKYPFEVGKCGHSSGLERK